MLAEISSSEADTAVLLIIFPTSGSASKAILLSGFDGNDGFETAAEALLFVVIVCGVRSFLVCRL